MHPRVDEKLRNEFSRKVVAEESGVVRGADNRARGIIMQTVYAGNRAAARRNALRETARHNGELGVKFLSGPVTSRDERVGAAIVRGEEGWKRLEKPARSTRPPFFPLLLDSELLSG